MPNAGAAWRRSGGHRLVEVSDAGGTKVSTSRNCRSTAAVIEPPEHQLQWQAYPGFPGEVTASASDADSQ